MLPERKPVTFDQIKRLRGLMTMTRFDALMFISTPKKFRDAQQAAESAGAKTIQVDFGKDALRESGQLGNDVEINEQLKTLEQRLLQGERAFSTETVTSEGGTPEVFTLSVYNNQNEIIRQRRVALDSGRIEPLMEMDLFYVPAIADGVEFRLMFEVRRSSLAFSEKIYTIPSKFVSTNPTQRDMQPAMMIELSESRQQGDISMIEPVKYAGYMGRATSSKGVIDNLRSQSIEVVRLNPDEGIFQNVEVTSTIETDPKNEAEFHAPTQMDVSTFDEKQSKIETVSAHFTLNLRGEKAYDYLRILDTIKGMDHSKGEEGWELAASLTASIEPVDGGSDNPTFSQDAPTINFLRINGKLVAADSLSSHHSKSKEGNWRGFIWTKQSSNKIILVNYRLAPHSHLELQSLILTQAEFSALRAHYNF